ncbi:iron sulfur cluster assembly protein [Schizosaccharomyces cryophilus OY26]|uniref:Iron sulfur cluster assembly protein n=1 Tax=Schizosaccharomyces cryophilus (strain OY26 / ATCC MYA-4695 / CBS 11777 / NBRC 106824 / NRRL Y48691) TaxID=653667 RepID=S9VNR5_SCHCR|nr:iron sulfur cluster assembly protein [Schizosaccharomyces cryophilus OY26]EPY49613.1 iron sulfur cluster assembly protein [Schizosaccharomyces cryophilus OY26]
MILFLRHQFKDSLRYVHNYFAKRLSYCSQEERLFPNIYKKERRPVKDALDERTRSEISSVLKKDPIDIIKTIERSGLRGKSSGIPTFQKLLEVRDELAKGSSSEKKRKTSVVVINAAENEPGTFKDRMLLLYEPLKIIEGALIASHAIDSTLCYVYTRKDYYEEMVNLQKAVVQSYGSKILGRNILGTNTKLDILVHPGAGTYITGEDSALLESLEGHFPIAMQLPQPISTKGLFGLPTLMLNVETAANLSKILKRESLNKEIVNSHETRLFCISGDVNNPGITEEILSIRLKELIERHAGGVKGGWDSLAGVYAGGPASGILNKEQCQQATMDYQTLEELGCSLGNGSLIVLNNQDHVVDSLLNFYKFYSSDTCHICPVCRPGIEDIEDVLTDLQHGTADFSEIQNILSRFQQPTQEGIICGFANKFRRPFETYVNNFQHDLIRRTRS